MAKLLSQTESSVTRWHEEGDATVIETVADVEPVVERAKSLHNEGYTRTKGGQRHVASVPIVVLDAWAKKQGKTLADVYQDQDLLTRFLRDPAHSFFLIDKSAV
jgi:hypothetical protein